MTELSLPTSRHSTGRAGAIACKAAALMLTLALASCGGDDDEVVIEGERISVMKLEDQLTNKRRRKLWYLHG